ncbi:ciliary microtubule inner protein 1-like [Antedon mediterranea]|uniref:ciliary microtubule inner protein 1-like n=1 Tax=Antedon mediterranea TaxID=105859 RepID=UPI003AF4B90E
MAAPPPTTSRKPKHPNFVHNDEIWKDHVRHELHAWRKWPDKWGFLTQEYNRLNRHLVGIPITPPVSQQRRGRPKSTIKHDKSLKLPVIDDIPSSDVRMTGKRSKLSADLNLPNIKEGTSTPKFVSKFPVTTAGEIGSRSTKAQHQLELYGRYAPNARGQHGILNLLKWPQQGL